MFDVSKLSNKKIIRQDFNLIDYLSMKEMKKCIVNLKINLESLISKNRRRDVIKLLYRYKHLNSEDLIDLSVIDLIIHRVTIKQETKSHFVNQKR